MKSERKKVWTHECLLLLVSSVVMASTATDCIWAFLFCIQHYLCNAAVHLCNVQRSFVLNDNVSVFKLLQLNHYSYRMQNWIFYEQQRQNVSDICNRSKVYYVNIDFDLFVAIFNYQKFISNNCLNQKFVRYRVSLFLLRMLFSFIFHRSSGAGTIHTTHTIRINTIHVIFFRWCTLSFDFDMKILWLPVALCTREHIYWVH